MLLVDGDLHDDATIEDVSEEIALRRGDRPSVLIVDSVQTARARGSQLATPRDRAPGSTW